MMVNERLERQSFCIFAQISRQIVRGARHCRDKGQDKPLSIQISAVRKKPFKRVHE